MLHMLQEEKSRCTKHDADEVKFFMMNYSRIDEIKFWNLGDAEYARLLHKWCSIMLLHK